MNNCNERLYTDKNKIIDFLFECEPTHMISFNPITEERTRSVQAATNQVRFFVKTLNQQMLGKHWIKDHIPCSVALEKGALGYYHFHILINLKSYCTDAELRELCECGHIKNKHNKEPHCINIKVFDGDKQKLGNYLSKQLQRDLKNTDILNNSYTLFNYGDIENHQKRHAERMLRYKEQKRTEHQPINNLPTCATQKTLRRDKQKQTRYQPIKNLISRIMLLKDTVPKITTLFAGNLEYLMAVSVYYAGFP